MTEESRRCVEWLNHYIKTDPAHKVIAHYVFGHNGDCGDYGEDWMWLDDICKQVINLIESLSAQLDQVTRERDAAVEDLKLWYCFSCNNRSTPYCQECSRNRVRLVKGYLSGRNHYEWRGVEVEG